MKTSKKTLLHDMKKHFFDSVISKMNENDSIYFITGDLGYPHTIDIENRFAKRFINFGVAEQSMVGFASGIAKSGGYPIIYSISNFLSMRALEQIRNDLIYHNLSALLVNGGSGFNYQRLGYTHHSYEDMGVLMSVGNIDIYNPSFPENVYYCLEDSIKMKNLAYLRLDSFQDNIYVPNSEALNSRSWINKKNNKKILISSGSITEVVNQAFIKMELFDNYDFVLVNKISQEIDVFLEELISNYESIYIIEEQKYFGSIISKFNKLVKSNSLKYLCIDDNFISSLSTKQILRENVGLDLTSVEKFLDEDTHK